jgi:hypothetical protein
MRSRTRAAAGLAVVVAAAVAVGVVTPAAGASGGRTGQWRYAAPAAPVAAERTGKPAEDPVLAGAARRFGLSEQRLEQALVDVKVYLGRLGRQPKLGLLDPGAVAVFARSLGIPVPRARAVLRYLVAAWAVAQKDKQGSTVTALPPAAVAFFAKTLHVSTKRAQVALDRLMKLSAGPRGIDPTDPAFARIARSLGVSPKQLTAALIALKKFLAHLPPEKGKPGPGKPGPGKPDPGKPGPGKPVAPAKPLPVGAG